MELVLSDRSLLRRARDQLDGWVRNGRDRAFDDLFAGPNPTVPGARLALLDRIDAALPEQTGVGLWGTDEYGIITGYEVGDVPFRVVCTRRPEIPASGYRGRDSIDEATRNDLNDVLYEYCERVASHAQADLERFLLSLDREH
ncbi:DUF7539 family protein [Haloarchaeobius amylolyticus]|uniref:DUF7539 family protein n=1 Tax=Haloarchaeobius amylolyticus TaxID=1198296 RepID=UPI00227117E6|nr:hypothetical protein [Haloarchaeobius amylolyticus]